MTKYSLHANSMKTPVAAAVETVYNTAKWRSQVTSWEAIICGLVAAALFLLQWNAEEESGRRPDNFWRENPKDNSYEQSSDAASEGGKQFFADTPVDGGLFAVSPKRRVRRVSFSFWVLCEIKMFGLIAKLLISARKELCLRRMAHS